MQNSAKSNTYSIIHSVTLNLIFDNEMRQIQHARVAYVFNSIRSMKSVILFLATFMSWITYHFEFQSAHNVQNIAK